MLGKEEAEEEEEEGGEKRRQQQSLSFPLAFQFLCISVCLSSSLSLFLRQKRKKHKTEEKGEFRVSFSCEKLPKSSQEKDKGII